MKLERKLNEPLFMAAFDEKLKANSNDPDAFLDDLTMFRQWLTNAAVFAVFDTLDTNIHSYHVHTRPLFRIGWIILVIIILILGYNFSKFLGTDEELMVKEEKHTNQFLYRNIRNPKASICMELQARLRTSGIKPKRLFL